jgi:hypothetical protein
VVVLWPVSTGTFQHTVQNNPPGPYCFLGANGGCVSNNNCSPRCSAGWKDAPVVDVERFEGRRRAAEEPQESARSTIFLSVSYSISYSLLLDCIFFNCYSAYFLFISFCSLPVCSCGHHFEISLYLLARS